MVTKAKLLFEQAYHALLGASIGVRHTYPFDEVCSTIGLTNKEWDKLKNELSLNESEITQIEDYLKEVSK